MAIISQDLMKRFEGSHFTLLIGLGMSGSGYKPTPTRQNDSGSMHVQRRLYVSLYSPPFTPVVGTSTHNVPFITENHKVEREPSHILFFISQGMSIIFTIYRKKNTAACYSDIGIYVFKEVDMLYKFEVSGFKAFDKKMTFSLEQTKNYEFAKDIIDNGVIKKSIIYGVNGVGKTNLGLAIFDVVSHLTDNEVSKELYGGFINAKNKSGLAEFTHHYKFNGGMVVYNYAKKDYKEIVFENLFINDVLVAKIDRRDGGNALIELPGTEHLKNDLSDSNISLITYINNNTVFEKDNEVAILFKLFVSYISKMLYFRSLDGNRYIGIENNPKSIAMDIVEHGNVKDFEIFLNNAGIECKLKKISSSGEKDSIAFDFGNKRIPFYTIASTGTKSLSLLYFWMQRLKEEDKVSLVFVDEFDAFYHHSLSVMVVKELKAIKSQVIMTTHNTSVMSNDILRPDCYFIMDNEGVTPISSKTDKELRHAHNIEKMYKAGSFND